MCSHHFDMKRSRCVDHNLCPHFLKIRSNVDQGSTNAGYKPSLVLEFSCPVKAEGKTECPGQKSNCCPAIQVFYIQLTDYTYRLISW